MNKVKKEKRNVILSTLCILDVESNLVERIAGKALRDVQGNVILTAKLFMDMSEVERGGRYHEL